MTLAELVPLALKGSIAALVFSIGLETAPKELAHFLKRPGQLLRSLVSMSLMMPIVALLLVQVLDLRKSVEIILVALALSPVPPILPRKLVHAGGRHAYIMALLFSVSAFSVLSIPVAGLLLDRMFAARINIPPSLIGGLVLSTVVGPTVAGMLVRLAAPKLAARIERPLSTVANVLLVLAGALVLVKTAPAMWAQIGDSTLLAISLFVVSGLVIGHLLGGPAQADRLVLALATASRHPGIAIAIAHVTFPEETAVLAAAVIYLVITFVLTVPYVVWRRRVMAATHSSPSVAPPAGTPPEPRSEP